MRAKQTLLTLDADLGQQDVPAVAQQLRVVEVDLGFQLSALGCRRAAGNAASRVGLETPACRMPESICTGTSTDLLSAGMERRAPGQKRLGPAKPART
jgi:hypothetical protein